MQLISLKTIRRWKQVGNGMVPGSISTICPHCGDKVVITLGSFTEDKMRNAVSATGNCPSCNKHIHVWSVHKKGENKDDQRKSVNVFIHPPVKGFYQVPELGPTVPDALKRSFISTIDAYKSGNFPATAVCCRRTLEGIFKFLIKNNSSNKNLYNLIDQAIKDIDLAKPLSDLSHAIRDGGNLGAHFDMEKEPNEEMARQMVELLDYLISYLYTLPNKITKLEQILDKDA